MSNQLPEGMRTTLGWVLGVAIIAFILLIMVIIFGNLQGNVGFGRVSTAFANETINITDNVAGSTPTTAQNRVNGVLTNIVVTNSTNTSEIVDAGNYTITGIYQVMWVSQMVLKVSMIPKQLS